MNWRLAALSLIFQLPILHAQDAAQLRAGGDEALSNGLWEIAAIRFGELLDEPTLGQEEKTGAALGLAEAWIRGGQAERALALLGESFLGNPAAARFWRAQALATLHRFGEAVDEFSTLLVDPLAPHRMEAARTCANLQLSLGREDNALATLTRFAASAPASEASVVRLQMVRLLLDQGKVTEARKTLDQLGPLPAAAAQRVAFIRARLLLAEAQPAVAATAFQELVENPRGQTLWDHHAAAIGLADSRSASGDREAAVAGLLSFIDSHPDSPLHDALFERLILWLPEALTESDPILERLDAWIPPPPFPYAERLTAPDPGATGAWPARSVSELRVPFAMFARSSGLRRVGTPASRAAAYSLMNRLRWEHPGHPLVSRALLETGRWHLEDGNLPRALATLDPIFDLVPEDARLGGRAAFLRAYAAYSAGDHDSATRGFQQAAESLRSSEAGLARLNAALASMRAGSGDAPTFLIQTQGESPELAADFELERALSQSAPAEKRDALEHFLERHPDHPRAPEARFAALEASLSHQSPDLNLARAQFGILQSTPAAVESLPADRLALARLRMADMEGDPAATIQAAKEVLEAFPDEAISREAAFTLGRNLFLTGDYNDARLVLEKLAANEEDSARAQAAMLLAARAASLGATTQSREEALVLFDKAISTEGPLEAIAVLEKGSFMIKSLNRYATAAAFLREQLMALPEEEHPLRLPLGLLLGEAIYAKGSSDPIILEEALEIYDGLIPLTDQQPALWNRLQYLRGMVLELLPRQDDPSLRRDAEALQAYVSVLEAGLQNPPAEWEYFELCGFRALEMLKSAQRWKAAIAIAEKIASFDSPNAREAAEAAQSLRLKHMIWDD
jgi:tetratricopeptide (TPR) repeat protein